MSAGLLGAGWRDRAWDRLDEPWDLLVVGGGISGAGIARRAARLGLRTLLLEQRDLAWGTSSRSSKLVHGGLRYLAQGQVGIVRESVRERERLLRAAPGLVEELGFLMPVYRGAKPGRLMYAAGLTAYDLLARRRTHRRLARAELELLAPRIRTEGLTGGFRYGDAQTDDARLTFRVVQDALAAGATVVSYARAEEVLQAGGRVVGVTVRDVVGRHGAKEVRATAVVSATGAWADRLRVRVGAAPRIRPLRGSHLLFTARRLPVYQAVSFPHPADGRPVFAFPWEGVTLVGTTDVDHGEDLDAEPRISPAEASYLGDALAAAFPALAIRPEDAFATFAGVRPVIGTGRADPSAESRDHALWDDEGLLTVTGGKLTTYDAIARDALGALRPRFAGRFPRDAGVGDPPIDPVEVSAGPRSAAGGMSRPDLACGADLAPETRRRLAGRYGRDLGELLAAAGDDELDPIPGTQEPWAAVRWAARAEGVVHLEDLLLRRVRLGLLLPEGGADVLEGVRAIVQPELGWDDARWISEEAAYRALWASDYAPPRGPEPVGAAPGDPTVPGGQVASGDPTAAPGEQVAPGEQPTAAPGEQTATPVARWRSAARQPGNPRR